MAFATSNTQKSYFGNLKVTYGQWSGAVGDAAGTIGVEGGNVWIALFVSQDSSGAYNLAPVKYSVSTSGAVSTVTVYNLAATTNGRFLIISA